MFQWRIISTSKKPQNIFLHFSKWLLDPKPCRALDLTLTQTSKPHDQLWHLGFKPYGILHSLLNYKLLPTFKVCVEVIISGELYFISPGAVVMVSRWKVVAMEMVSFPLHWWPCRQSNTLALLTSRWTETVVCGGGSSMLQLHPGK